MTANNGQATTQNKTKLPRSRRKLIRNIVIAVVGLTICGSVVVIGGLVWLGNLFSGDWIGFTNLQCVVSNPAGIQDVAEFKLPPSAKLLTSSCGGMQGWAAWASFEMNPNDLNTFLALQALNRLYRIAIDPKNFIVVVTTTRKLLIISMVSI